MLREDLVADIGGCFVLASVKRAIAIVIEDNRFRNSRGVRSFSGSDSPSEYCAGHDASNEPDLAECQISHEYLLPRRRFTFLPKPDYVETRDLQFTELTPTIHEDTGHAIGDDQPMAGRTRISLHQAEAKRRRRPRQTLWVAFHYPPNAAKG